MKASAFALPLIAAGAAWRLLRHGRRGVFGHALAGFGLVFLGIATLQEGMADATTQIAVAGTADQLGGRIVLVLVGALMTVIAQSSSAAVAMTITALASGALDLEAAAALVIGQNVGTTVTALLGSIGGGVAVRRAAVGHLLFNVLTGLVAFSVLGPAVQLIDWVAAESATRDPAVELALFHTVFNLFGVAMVLPVLGSFARLVERMVPEPAGATAGLQLSSATIAVPGVALEMARRALVATFARALQAVEQRTRPLAAPLPELVAARERLAADAIGPGDVAEVAGALAAASRGLAQARKGDRGRVLEEVAVGSRPAEDADARLGAARLVDRLGYHAWRAAHALRESALEVGLPHDATPDDPSR